MRWRKIRRKRDVQLKNRQRLFCRADGNYENLMFERSRGGEPFDVQSGVWHHSHNKTPNGVLK